MPGQPRHIHPTAPLAPRALLPGDPGRALLLAQELTDEPPMFNHNRALWGYTGTASRGAPPPILLMSARCSATPQAMRWPGGISSSTGRTTTVDQGATGGGASTGT